MPGRGLNHPWDPGACVCSSTLQTSGWTSVPATPELLCPWQGGAEPRAVAVPALAGPGAEPGTLQPRLLGRQWWALPAGQDVVQHLPFPCLCPAPGPGSMASGRIALFVPLDVLHFLRKQPIVLAGNSSLSWGQPGGTLVLFCGAPSSLL